MTHDRLRRVAVFGLGEAGRLIAADLAATRARVTGYDPAPHPTPTGVTRCADPAAAVEGVDLVLAITAAADARSALCQALDRIPQGALYADLSTASAAKKRDLAALAGERGLAFADVALMSTVPGKGVRTPQLVSGAGAERYARLLAPTGVTVTTVGEVPGDAATHKLLRSIVMKGLAALVIEAMQAGEAAGTRDWLWAHLVDEITAADEALLRRIVVGAGLHDVRRRLEMQASSDLLDELGVEPVMSRATVERFRRVSEEGVPELPVEANVHDARLDRPSSPSIRHRRRPK